jgi:hypothetical protein
VPADPAFAPLWPVAAHGALAAVLLLDDASPDSTEALRGPMQALCARPRARTFHVVLMRQSDDPGAAELPEPLASLEERWRLLLPLNDDEDAMDAVRCLLTRVIP